jgi:2,4-dienoyl-CoA reductase-like NADH-dependent reductase (Old Yellow Enzyme family)
MNRPLWGLTPDPGAQGPALFKPCTLRGITMRNRVVISPMQQYSASDGIANEWHLVHLARFALGGAGTVFVGATAVEPRGRNTHGDLGLWHDGQVVPLARVARILRTHGAVPGIQLGHTGRKAGLQKWWEGHGPLDEGDAARGEGPWPVVGPSALPMGEGYPVPHALTEREIGGIVHAYGEAARRAHDAGFELLEIHAAHGYLIHQFLSPLANQRVDAYGGDVERRQRFALEVAASVRRHWPARLPLSWRLSLPDLDDGSLTPQQLIRFICALRERGVDIIDASSGGGVTSYPTNLSRPAGGLDFRADEGAMIRREAGIAVMAVGGIVAPEQAERLLLQGQADLVALGREALFNPNWAVHAELALGVENGYASWPRPYRMWLAKRGTSADLTRRGAARRSAGGPD